jgi:hypothetical protein
MPTTVRGGRFFIDASSAAKLKTALADFPPAYFVQAKETMKKETGVLKATMIQRSSLPPGPKAPTAGVHKQTGRLASSWFNDATGTSLANLQGIAKSFARDKAPLLEFGGPVTAKTENWIYIPTDLNRDGSGAAIRTPKQVQATGSLFVNRHTRRWMTVPPAIVDGKTSPAWNLLIDRNVFALQQWAAPFIMAKSAQYRPQLGFFVSGNITAAILPEKLAEASIKAWNTTEK